jgi:hypothetical protein
MSFLKAGTIADAPGCRIISRSMVTPLSKVIFSLKKLKILPLYKLVLLFTFIDMLLLIESPAR